MSRVRAVNNAGTSGIGTYPSTSTGNLLNGMDLYQVCSSITVNFNHPSTKVIAWKSQGSLHGVHWTDLNAAPSSSTGTGAVNSTVGGLYNKIRIVTSANATTGNITTKWVVAGTP